MAERAARPLCAPLESWNCLVYGSGAALAQSSMCSALIGPAQHHIEARGRGLWLGLAHSGSLRAQGSVRRRRQNGLRQLRQAWRSPALHAQLPHLLQAESGQSGTLDVWQTGSAIHRQDLARRTSRRSPGAGGFPDQADREPHDSKPTWPPHPDVSPRVSGRSD